MSVVISHLSHTYDPKSATAYTAIEDISVTFEQGEMIGVIGHTGSGKSTLIQHLNGLILPQKGSVTVNGVPVEKHKDHLKQVRRTVGMVFQYPEHQLFEETVAKDIAFGPKMLGLPEAEIDERVAEAMRLVSLDASLAQRSPFELSGGQKRRVAIAGVMAMQPEILVMDEPVAGLDPRGREELLDMIEGYWRTYGATVMIVSHNMDDVARLSTRIAVMNHGALVMYDTPEAVFSRVQELTSMGLDVPHAAKISAMLAAKGKNIPFCLDLETLAEEIAKKRK